MVRNDSEQSILIPAGTKLAQGVLEKINQAVFTLVDELSDTTKATLSSSSIR